MEKTTNFIYLIYFILCKTLTLFYYDDDDNYTGSIVCIATDELSTSGESRCIRCRDSEAEQVTCCALHVI